MTNFTAEFLHSETDAVVEIWTFEASCDAEAVAKAEDEAEYQGFFVGTVAAA